MFGPLAPFPTAPSQLEALARFPLFDCAFIRSDRRLRTHPLARGGTDCLSREDKQPLVRLIVDSLNSANCVERGKHFEILQ